MLTLLLGSIMAEPTEKIEDTLFRLTKQKVMPDDPVIQLVHAMLQVLDKHTEQCDEKIDMFADIANKFSQELDDKQKSILTTLDEKNEELNHILTQIQQNQTKESAKLKQREVIIGLIGFGFGLVVCMVFSSLST